MVMAGVGKAPLKPNFLFHRHLYIGPTGKGLVWAPAQMIVGHPGRFVYISFGDIHKSLYLDLLDRATEKDCGCLVLYTDLFRHVSDSQIRSNLWWPPENYCIHP